MSAGWLKAYSLAVPRPLSVPTLRRQLNTETLRRLHLSWWTAKDIVRPASSPARYCPIDSTFNILHPRFGGDLSEPLARDIGISAGQAQHIATACQKRVAPASVIGSATLCARPQHGRLEVRSTPPTHSAGTSEVPLIADGIAAPPRTVSWCQLRTWCSQVQTSCAAPGAPLVAFRSLVSSSWRTLLFSHLTGISNLQWAPSAVSSKSTVPSSS